MTSYVIIDILIAFIIDLVFGDPYWFPHPIRFIGWMISRTENFLRDKLEEFNRSKNSKYMDNKHAKDNLRYMEKYAGIVLMVFVVLSTFTLVFLILKIAELINPVLFHIINIYFIYSSLATKCLANEAMKVSSILKKRDIIKARKSLAMLVGRDTNELSENEIIRGTLETTAENTVDGVISPIIYIFIGSLFGIGAPLVYAFKAVSTLDSMIGYMNEKYIDLGCASAKTDDVANYIPARFSGLLIPISSFFLGMDFKKSFYIMLRDRKNHKSPNCAYPEAAVAGALGIEIGGTNTYFGQIVKKPTIGDADREIKVEDIASTVKLMYMSAVFSLGICFIVYFAISML